VIVAILSWSSSEGYPASPRVVIGCERAVKGNFNDCSFFISYSVGEVIFDKSDVIRNFVVGLEVPTGTIFAVEVGFDAVFQIK
jgi:hypothetical protein